MIEILYNALFDYLFHHSQVSYVAGFRVDFALNTHFQLIVVAVVVGIAAGAKYSAVLLNGPGRIVEAMSCVEMDSTGHFDCRHAM